MALDTYTNLVSAVGNWLGRSDLSAQINDAITLFETECNNGSGPQVPPVRVLEMVKTSTLTTVKGVTSYSLPSDYLEIYVPDGTGYPRALQFMTLDALANRFNNFDSGAPKAFAIDVGNTLAVAPIPDGTYTFDVRYYGKIPSLLTNATNWLLTKSPNAYLFGVLSYLQLFVVDDERFAIISNEKAKALAGIMDADQRARAVGSALRPQVSGMTP